MPAPVVVSVSSPTPDGYYRVSPTLIEEEIMNSDTFHFGSKTATAGTAISRTLPGRKNRYLRTTHVRYKPGTTAHTVTILQSLAETTVDGTALAAQADIILAADPGGLTPAANDYMIFKKPDGTLFT